MPLYKAPIIEVSSLEVEEFERAIVVACIVKSPKPLDDYVDDYVRARPEILLQIKAYAEPNYFRADYGCVPLSFDNPRISRWHPFLLSTKGYHPKCDEGN